MINASPSGINESSSYIITDSRPFTKQGTRFGGGGDFQLDENKNYMNLEEHSRVTEDEDGKSSVGKVGDSLTFMTSRPHHKVP